MQILPAKDVDWHLPKAISWSAAVVSFRRAFLQCEAPKIAKLVYNSNNYGLWYL